MSDVVNATSHVETQPIVEDATSAVVEVKDLSDISSFKSRMLDKAMNEDDFKNALIEAVKYIEYARTKYNFFKEELEKGNDKNLVNDAAKTLAVIMKCILLKVIDPWGNKHFDKNAFYSAAWTGLKTVFKGKAVSEEREKVKDLLNAKGPYSRFNKLKGEIIELLNAHTDEGLGGYKFSKWYVSCNCNNEDLKGIKVFNETGAGIILQRSNFGSSGKRSSGTGMSMRATGGLKKKRKSMKKGKKTLKSKKGGKKSRKSKK